MKNCIGIINSSQVTSNEYKSLSKARPDYMLPFGGRYRVIDFALSNMSNNNLSKVILYSGKHIRSTLDHIGDGKNWELNRRSNGLTINPPAYDLSSGTNSEIQTYFDSMPFFEFSTQEYIYIDNPMYIVKPNLRQAFDQFEQGDYDVMLFYDEVEDPRGTYINMNKLILDGSGNLVNVGINLGTETAINLYIGNIFMKKKVFIDIVKDGIEKGNAHTMIQAIMNNKSRLKIGTYKIEGHIEVIHDLLTYYRANMNLLDSSIYEELFYKGGMVYTKSKDEPSTLYREGSRVSNSLVANGCIIEGQVENSIIFRGVHVAKNAIVKNSVLIQKTKIEEDAVVVNTITDKYAIVRKGVSLVGSTQNPFVVEKSQIVER